MKITLCDEENKIECKESGSDIKVCVRYVFACLLCMSKRKHS